MAYLLVSTVTAYIAGLSVTATMPDVTTKALTIRDLGAVTGSVESRDCPILYPDPVNLWRLRGVPRDSLGPRAVAKQRLLYELNYRMLYLPFGSERDLAGILPGLVTTVGAVLTAFIQNDAPGGAVVDAAPVSGSFGGTVTDPSGKKFHGADFTLSVTEFVN